MNGPGGFVRCDLHVHSRYSTDSGNYALRRARVGESFTRPERVAAVCRRRGMTLVTISDHNTIEGALRIAHLDGAFISVEVTTHFPEDDVPLHVLVWNLTEEDHRDLQEWRPSVYELVGFLRDRGLVHGLAHPLYRMGAPLTISHVERMMLLFGVWEGRNGARPQEANELACRLAAAVTPEYLAKLAERHDLEPCHRGRIALTGGSDDHGALDIATTWTEAEAEDPAGFLAAVQAGEGTPHGAHGSTTKLAHAIASLFVHAYRESGGALPAPIGRELEELFDADADSAEEHHRLIADVTARAARLLAAEFRTGFGVAAMPDAGRRLAVLALAGALHLPYLATAHHRAGSRAGLHDLELGFFGATRRDRELRALVFTDTLAETNGVAGTMRQLAGASARLSMPVSIVAAGTGEPQPGVLAVEAEWEAEIPGYESLRLRFPSPRDILELVEGEAPEVVHVATPGPVGACGLLAAKLLGLPIVGSWHTELGPYALHLTRDQLIADAFERYIEWFYRQCDIVLAPTTTVAHGLAARGFAEDRLRVWGRGVDAELFTPLRRSEGLRARLALDGAPLLLYVGRISDEKRLQVLIDAFSLLAGDLPDLRLVIVGDGPAREQLETAAPKGVAFLGELRGRELAQVYATADVFCFPSTTDTFGQVLLEAAAAGLPSVAADAGGAPELVRQGATGLLVPPNDPRAFARALDELVRDPSLRSRLGAAAREWALDWTWGRSHAQLLDAYREAAGAVEAASAPVAA
jgi:glycosyltransferase involved in cell wall biosynthesis/predicted metal-dependent phosphoesterase TrpH